jgi:hypothetical protein
MTNRKRYGMIAGLAGAASLAAWWLRRRSAPTIAEQMTTVSEEHGQVIYSNTPL